MLAVGACAPKPGKAPVQPAPAPPEAAEAHPPAPPVSLKDHLTSVAEEQYFSSKNLYISPPAGMKDKFYVQISREPAALHLATDVTAYAATRSGLAVGREDGSILVYGAKGCSSLLLPGNRGVERISWHEGSRYLAAVPDDGKRVTVFDLTHCAGVSERAFNSTIHSMALSPRGSWLGVSDTAHSLWVGPPMGGGLSRVTALRYEALDMAFTPQEGLLMVIDEAGWLTLWAPLSKKMVDMVQVPFGPFEEAAFFDTYIDLFPKEGEPVRWDILNKQVVPREAQADPYSLSQGVLTYRTFKDLLVRKAHFRAPNIRVKYSPSAKALKVADLDGETRFYAHPSGRPVEGQMAAGDFRPVELDGPASFEAAGEEFVLGERIFQRDHDALFCRHVPGSGFFLWWSKRNRPDEFNPHPQALPARNTLAPEEPVQWTPIEPIKELL